MNNYYNGILKKSKTLLILGLFAMSFQINAQTLSTFSGNGNYGYVDGIASISEYRGPEQLVVDKDNYIYITEYDNNVIRRISPDGTSSTFAGNGTNESIDGPLLTASFNSPQGICIDETSGAIYISDTESHLIRKIDTLGMVTTVAGTSAGFADGPLLDAAFNLPTYIGCDGIGNVYVADNGNERVRKINFETGLVSTIGGNGIAGYQDGDASTSRFNFPRGIAVDDKQNVYVGDQENNAIRKITPDGIVSTVAGGGSSGHQDGLGEFAKFNGPKGVSVDSVGNLYVGDRLNFVVRKIDTMGIVTTIAGIPGVSGYEDGDILDATIGRAVYAHPYGPNKVLITDWGNDVIRIVNLESNTTEIVTISSGDKVEVFPNPAVNIINIESEYEVTKYVLYSSGMKIQSTNTSLRTKEFQLEMSDFASGVYFLHLYTGNQLTIKKIIKQ